MTNDHIGIFEVQCKNKITGKITIDTIYNKIPNSVLSQLINPLTGVTTNLIIKYLAVGTGGGVTSDTQTTLNAEMFRTVPVSAPTLTNVGRVETGFTILDVEANVHIMELGIFVGVGATASFNTGILLSRVQYDKVKTNSEEISINRIDILKRG